MVPFTKVTKKKSDESRYQFQDHAKDAQQLISLIKMKESSHLISELVYVLYHLFLQKSSDHRQVIVNSRGKYQMQP